MKPAVALIVLGFASFTALAQEPGDPPIKVAPPVIEEIAPRPDSPPKRMPPAEESRSQVVPARQRLQPKPIEEQPIEIEVPRPRSRPTRVEIDLSDIEPARGQQLPNGLDLPKVDPTPVLPNPKYVEGPFEAPIPGGMPISGLEPEQNYRPLYLDLQTIDFTIPGAESLFGPPNPVRGNWADGDMFQYRVGPDSAFQLDGLFRGYFRNDQRIAWSGVEATFGAEGVLRPSFVSRTGDWIVSSQGEFFLNKRYGTSILSDADRDLYRTNFDVETFQIFQMFVEANYNDFTIRLGRSRTPFGRYQSPMYTNSTFDAPFIRTEVIGFVETGMFFHYAPDPFVIDLAIVNGEPDLDTNSSKAVVTRWGVERQNWTAGISAKVQDGISSEFQKRFNNVFGIDGSVSLGRFLIYGEGVIDQHGFLRDAENNPEFNPLNLGIRSLYARDVFKEAEKAINGNGAYVGVCYRADDWLLDISYGRYIPERIGNEDHDKPTNRFLMKTSYIAARNLEVYLVVLAENKRFTEGLLSNSKPYSVWFGMQYGF